MIRKARRNYVCECCGHIIRAGSEYLDKVILNNGKCVQHNRYHDICPKSSLLQILFDNLDNLDKVILNNGKCVQHNRYHDICPKSSLLQILFDKLDRANGDLPVAYHGEKIHIIGIAFDNKGPVIICREWLGTAKIVVPFSEVSAMVDLDGNALV